VQGKRRQTGEGLSLLIQVGIRKRLRWAFLGRAGQVLLALALIVAAASAPFGEASAAKRRASAGAPPIAAAIVVDMNTGIILDSQAPDTPRYPASLTKMMTLYVLFGCLKDGKISLSSDLTVTPHAEIQAPTKLGLKQGMTIKVEDAIKALVTQSANDAAVTIAENLAGTEENFARYMTQTARSIGMANTTFRNASGLPDDEQVTTARDMATLATHLIHDYPEYYGVFETRYFTYSGRKYRNHNHLLFGYKGTDGIKTGYTKASGFNLTASVHRGDKHLVAVVLGGKTGSQRDAAMRALLDKNFAAASESKPTKEQLVAALVSPSGGPTPAPVPQVVKPAEPAPAPQVVEAAAPTPVPQVVKPAPAAKPALTAAETELETFVSQSPAKASKPSFALASVAPEPSTVGTPNDVGQGDTGEPSDSANDAALPWGASQKKLAKQKYAGAFHVQVGAYTSESEAESRLGVVQQRASDLLDGHLPFTTSFTKEGAEWYRARFAGFSRGDAQSVCDALKKMSVDCVVMKAE
jgi:D-alanyl-D-alanine carboxypeptidase